MDLQQNQKFQFVNYHDPTEADQLSTYNHKNRFSQFNIQYDPVGIFPNLGWKNLTDSALQNQKLTKEALDQQLKQKERKIKKLTQIHKHYLQKLKQLNDQLTKKIQKQKFTNPKRSIEKSSAKNDNHLKQLQGVKKELQNAHKQIESYKETISLLKAKQLPASEQDKLIEYKERLRLKNKDIERIHEEIKIQKMIKQNQTKQISKVDNTQMAEVIRKLDEDILNSKLKLKQLKKVYKKRQQVEKKQHIYFLQLQSLLKKSKNQQNQIQLQNQLIKLINQDEIPQSQWKSIYQKLAQEKIKYQNYGKKVTYHNYIKSKLTKNLEELQLKLKEKTKYLSKLNSKMIEVNKLAKLKPSSQISPKVQFKMEKLKDIISRQSSIETNLTFRVKLRAQSQDVRQFKKWQLLHAQRQNDDVQINISKIKLTPQSQLNIFQNKKMGIQLNDSQEQIQA